MKFSKIFGLFILTSSSSQAFVPSSTSFIHHGLIKSSPATTLQMSSSPDGQNDPLKSSRIDGNQRAPSPNEIAIMDEMITKMMNAKPYELPNAVSKAIRVVSSPRFFVRIAERSDMASAEEKQKLSALAENLVTTLEAVVSTTEDKLDERAKEVEKVLKAASEPDSGEFLVPLSEERILAMRQVLQDKIDPSSLDEGFLTTVDAWMNKSSQDGMDGMVVILQKVLQMYAGTSISRARKALQVQVGAAVTGKDLETAEKLVEENTSEPKPALIFMEELLNMDTDEWNSKLQQQFASEDGVKPRELMGEVQRTIEGVVLGLENGSMAQRVQAEFLRELVSRIESLEKDMGL